MAQETQTEVLYQSRGVGWAGDGRVVQKGGDICTPMADSTPLQYSCLENPSDGGAW